MYQEGTEMNAAEESEIGMWKQQASFAVKYMVLLCFSESFKIYGSIVTFIGVYVTRSFTTVFRSL
jgi:hypothetical protein